MQSSNPVVPVVTLGLLLSFATLLSPATAAPPPKRPEAQQEFWSRYDTKDWSAAIDEARKLVETARANTEQRPLALANALTLLGNAQLSSGDKMSAEASYREALQVTELHVGAGSPSIVDPLRGLGYTLALLERHQEAIPYLERALVISRRSYGLYDMGQQGALRQLASSLAQTGRAADGAKQMMYLLRIGERTYGERDPRMAPLLRIVGDWYADIGHFSAARDVYREAAKIVERKLGKNDPALVDPLRALARSYVEEVHLITQGFQPVKERASMNFEGADPAINPKYINSDGEKALERAIAILEARPDTKPLLLIDTLIQLGDWFQLKHQPEKSLVYYRRAAALFASIDAASPEAVAAPLSFPVRVYYPMPPLAMRNRQLAPEQIEEKFVAVEFTVTGNGDVQDAKVIEQNGTARQASEALQSIRASRYRPKFVDGEPVATQGVVNREVFKTRKQDPDEERRS